MIQNISDFR